ncbi:MAG: hypothetical protein R3300_00590 [Candidatus Promineifilaceae bacterium]|nr:hypothetical protein [Candidatus Promineifilaceae bacterium]
MNEAAFLRLAGWSAYAAAGAAIISFVALFIFFAVGGFFGPINDLFSVFQMLFLIPVALALHQLLGETAPILSAAALVVGIGAMVVLAGLQAALVAGLVAFEQTLRPVLAVGGVLGLWWLAVGYLSFQHDGLPNGLAWAALVSGASFVAIVVGFGQGGQEHPLAAVGFLIGAVAVPIWSIWLGRLLLGASLAVSG